jgi:rhodanese-related sulfurtransferase
MAMQINYQQLIKRALAEGVDEIMPWDLAGLLIQEQAPLLIDVREPEEHSAMHIRGAKNVPRGLLEAACEFGYEDTVPALAKARDSAIVIVCRSGFRSVLAAQTLKQLGFKNVISLATGVRGWADYEQPLIDAKGNNISIEQADTFFTSSLRKDQQL